MEPTKKAVLLGALIRQRRLDRNMTQEEALMSAIHFESAVGDEKRLLWHDATKKLRELEEMISDTDHLTQQFIIHCKIVLGKEAGVPYTPEEKLDLLMEAIRLTVPRFDIEKINGSLYFL